MSLFKDEKGEPKSGAIVTVISLIVLLVIVASMIILPQYNVWRKELAGKAQLKEAEWNRQITIKEAEAEKESAKLKKDTDIIRAEGIAEANKIISETITTEFIQWKWVEGLHDGSSEVIYVPTETNLPILEAGRFQK